MIKLILITAMSILIMNAEEAQAIQFMHIPARNANQAERDRIHQLNMQEERQEMMRKQLEVQEKMLRLQERQQKGW